VLDTTGADALMIGRAAQGRPWLFREIAHYLDTGRHLPPPDPDWIRATLLGHLEALYAFYGSARGVRIARKHIGWTLRGRTPALRDTDDVWLARINRAETTQEQTTLVSALFDLPEPTAQEVRRPEASARQTLEDVA
jgi:tRNA-dihydrouridine synthase B